MENMTSMDTLNGKDNFMASNINIITYFLPHFPRFFKCIFITINSIFLRQNNMGQITARAVI